MERRGLPRRLPQRGGTGRVTPGPRLEPGRRRPSLRYSLSLGPIANGILNGGRWRFKIMMNFARSRLSKSKRNVPSGDVSRAPQPGGGMSTSLLGSGGAGSGRSPEPSMRSGEGIGPHRLAKATSAPRAGQYMVLESARLGCDAVQAWPAPEAKPYAPFLRCDALWTGGVIHHNQFGVLCRSHLLVLTQGMVGDGHGNSRVHRSGIGLAGTIAPARILAGRSPANGIHDIRWHVHVWPLPLSPPRLWSGEVAHIIHGRIRI